MFVLCVCCVMGRGLVRGVCKKWQTLNVTRPGGLWRNWVTKRRQQRLPHPPGQADGRISRSTRLGLGPCLACRRNPGFFWISLRITFFYENQTNASPQLACLGQARRPLMTNPAKKSQHGMGFPRGGEVELDRRSAAVYLHVYYVVCNLSAKDRCWFRGPILSWGSGPKA